MKKVLVFSVAICLSAISVMAQEFNTVPRAWKWIGNDEVLFTYDGSYADSSAFAFNARTSARRTGVSAPAKFSDFPIKPEGAVNMTYSPDSSTL